MTQFQVGQREIAGLPYIDWRGWRIVDTKDGKLMAINLAELHKMNLDTTSEALAAYRATRQENKEGK